MFLESPWTCRCQWGQRRITRVLGGGGRLNLPDWNPGSSSASFFFCAFLLIYKMGTINVVGQYFIWSQIFAVFFLPGRIHLCPLLLDLAGWLALPSCVTSGQKHLKAGTWFSITYLPWGTVKIVEVCVKMGHMTWLLKEL